jgi:hypothetical protein
VILGASSSPPAGAKGAATRIEDGVGAATDAILRAAAAGITWKSVPKPLPASKDGA